MIKNRQFPKSHEDMHFASALFRYEKKNSVYVLKSTVIYFVQMINIKLKFESHDIQQQQLKLVAMGKRFEVSDNDFKIFSITPRIALSMKTPDSIEETFYVGKVSVILKESVFELSSPQRHAAEMLPVIDHTKPIVIYSDGGPDHHVTCGSVQLSFKKLMCFYRVTLI